MKKVNLQSQILQVLQDNGKEGSSGLSVTEIAKSVYGNGYIRKTAFELEKTIRQRMGIVCELAASNGITVFAQRKSCNPKTPEIKSRIACWCVYNPEILGMNEALTDELLYKKHNGEARTASFHRLLTTAKEKGAIESNKLKELELHQ